MSKPLMVVAALGLLAGLSFAADEKKEGKPQTIKQIMKLCYEEETGLQEEIEALVKEKEPKWADVSTKTKLWVKAAEDMGKNKPKKGSAESWETQTKKWLTEATNLDTSAGKKNVEGVNAALKNLGSACKACHSVHK